MAGRFVEIRFKRTPLHSSSVVGKARAGATLKKAMGAFGNDVANAIASHCVVMISNAKSSTVVIKASKWKSTTLQAGDRITITAIPGELGTFAVWLITLITTLAVGYYLLPDIPDAASVEGGSLYTFGGGSNYPEPYTPIPVLYGKFRTKLKFTARPSGKVNLAGGAQDYDYLKVLGTFGPGEVAIDDVHIGDVAINEAVSKWWFYAGDEQYPPANIPYYSRTYKTEPVLKPIDGTDNKANDWVEFRTLNRPEGVRFDISYPSGLEVTSERSGNHYATTVEFDFEIKSSDSDGWAGAKRYRRSSRRHTRQPFYASFQFDIPQTDAYLQGADVRIRRLGTAGKTYKHYQYINGSQLVRVESWRADEPNLLPANYSIFSAQIKADARISGSIPVISALASRKIKDYSAIDLTQPVGDGNDGVLAFTDNPAWVYLDVLFGVNGEQRIAYDEVDWQVFLQWAKFCDYELTHEVNGEVVKGKTATFNAVIDRSQTVDKLLRAIAGAGYAAPSLRGNKYSVYWEARHADLDDQPSQYPVALITPATTRRFIAKKAWIDKVHGYRVSFFDPNEDYEVNQVIAYADGYGEDNATIIKDIDARKLGCTSATAAWRYGRFKLADDIVHQESFTLEVNLDSLVFEVGDVVAVVNDSAKIGGVYGRLVRAQMGLFTDADRNVGLIAAFKLDQPIPLALRDAGVQIRQPDDKGAAGGANLRIELPLTNGENKVLAFHTFTPTADSEYIANGYGTVDGKHVPLLQGDDVVYAIAKQTTAGGDDAFYNAILALQSQFANAVFDEMEYSLGALGSDAVICAIHNISPQRNNTARIVMQVYQPQALVASWQGDIPAHTAIVSSTGIDTARNAPPLPAFTQFTPSAVINPADNLDVQVSNVFVAFDPVEIGGRYSNVREVLLQWRLEGADDWIGGIQFAYLPAVLRGIPVNRRYEVRAAYRDERGTQGRFATATNYNDALKHKHTNAIAPVVNALEIEGQGNDTEFYARDVALVWRDAASVVDAETTVGELQGLGAGAPQLFFKSYEVKLFGIGDADARELLATKEVLQARVEFVDLSRYGYRKFAVDVVRNDLQLGASVAVSLRINNPPPAPTKDDFEVEVGVGYYVIKLSAKAAAIPDLRSIVIVDGDVIVGEGIGRQVRVDAAQGIAAARNVRVYLTDAFNPLNPLEAGADWGYAEVEIGVVPTVETTPKVLTDEGALVDYDAAAIPPAPLDLEGASSPSAILMSWRKADTIPLANGDAYNFHGHTEIWRAAGGADATDADVWGPVGDVHLSQFVDGAVSGGLTYQYRIRFISASGVAGAYSAAVAVVAGRDDIDGAQVVTGQISAARIDAENIVAGSLVAKASITAPRIYGATQIHGGLDAHWVGGVIEGAVIKASTILADTTLYACVPPQNSQGDDLYALSDGFGQEITNEVVINKLRNGSSSGGWFVINHYADLLITTNELDIPSSSYEDANVVARYRWGEVAPSLRFNLYANIAYNTITSANGEVSDADARNLLDYFIGTLKFKAGSDVLYTTGIEINTNLGATDLLEIEIGSLNTKYLMRIDAINPKDEYYSTVELNGLHIKVNYFRKTTADGFTITITPKSYNDYFLFTQQGLITAELAIIELRIPVDKNDASSVAIQSATTTISDDPNNLVRRKIINSDTEDDSDDNM